MVKMTSKHHFKIVCIVQIYNEIEKGNLERFFNYIFPVADEIVVYDDCSTDGSFEYALKATPHVIRGSKNDFSDEINHKTLLLDYALKLKPDFILWMDADEVLPKNAKNKLLTLCKLSLEKDIDAYEFNYLNIWRSNCWIRIDSLYDQGWFVKLWKVSPGLSYKKSKRGLHQQLYPQSLKKISKQNLLPVLHYGFSNKLNLAYKYLTYKSHGQRGYVMLDRIINEDGLQLKKVPTSLFPGDLGKSEKKPKAIPFSEALTYTYQMKNHIFRPKYSIACLIYKSTLWLEFVYEQILKYTDMQEVEFYFVANDASDEVIHYLKKNHILYYEFNNTEPQRSEWYINNVYRAYNFSAKVAKGDFLILINSDMCFSPGWLDALKASYNGRNLISSRLVESGKLMTGAHGIEKNFGRNISEYREEDFLNFAKSISQNKLVDQGLFMPLFVRKSDFLKVGGYPEGNLKEGAQIFSGDIAKESERSISGDVILMKKMESIGVTHQTSMASIVYHFQCGEKDDNVAGLSKKIVEIAICNDNCDGLMGEKVLWNHLLENIAGAYRVDKNLIGKFSFELKARDYINLNHPETQVIVQNASFMDRVDGTKYSILFLQDNLRLMGRSSVQQESNLKFADVLVTNSVQTSMSYPEYDFEIIPIGVDSNLFKPKNKSNLRLKYGLKMEGKIGIFVGSFSDTKGWAKVVDCVRFYSDITWILVTKYKNEEFSEVNARVFKHLKQDILSELLNCADFFIIGSPVETQCLAALEANFCNVPVVMPLVGIYKDFSEEERISVGVFGDDLIEGVREVLSNNYEPRDLLLSKGLGIEDTIKKWNELIDKSCYAAKLKQIKNYNNSSSHSFLNSIFFKASFLTRTILIKYFLGEYYWKINNLMTLSGIKSILRSFLIKIELLNFAKKILGRK